MENGSNVIAFHAPVVPSYPRIAFAPGDAENDNAFASYYLLLKPQFPVTDAELRRRGREGLFVTLASIALSACAALLGRVNALAGILLFAIIVFGIVRLHRRRVAAALARKRAFFFTTVRAPEYEDELDPTLLPYVCGGWQIEFLQCDGKCPAIVFGNPEDLRPLDLLDAIHDILPDEQRADCALRTYDYIRDPLGP